MKRIISAIQASGKVHIGNYFGAMKQHISLQNEFETYIFVADLHALTTEKNPEILKNNSLEIALNYLALGLDPEKAILFKQSDVPLVCELSWIFDCITQVAFIERGHAWKDAKNNKSKDPNMGLLNYPVLMAADILLYSADFVPVGKDQKQHIEITRDIGKSFNNLYGETFKIPEAYITKNMEIIAGTDGRKMSKSYNNTIQIFAEENILKNQIMGIVSDSKGIEDKKDPETCNIFAIYKLFTTEEQQIKMAERYRNGGLAYGDVKKELFEIIMNYFADARKKYQKLSERKADVLDIFEQGRIKAKKTAEAKLDEIRQKVGLKF